MKPDVVTVCKLTKKYGNYLALNDLNFKIKAHEKVALLGCNGAGKTTLIHLLSGLKKVSDGDIKVFGKTPLSPDLKFKIAYLPQTLKFLGHLKVKEIIELIEVHFQKKLNPEFLERLDLTPLLQRYTFGLSGGEERKLGLALSLIGDRPFMILDEPTANVDLKAKNEIHSILHDLSKNSSELGENAFLFSSHEMSEVEKLADRVLVLNKGRIVADGSVSAIKKQFGSMTVVFESEDMIIDLKTTTKIERSPSDRSTTEASSYFKSMTPDQIKKTWTYTLFGPNSDLIIQELVENKYKFKNLTLRETSLDEVFLKLWS